MKRLGIIGLVLICMLIVVGMIIPASAVGSYVCGDADDDGEVTVMDATVIQRELVSLSNKSYNELAADVNGDGVNILDATSIQRFLADYAVNAPIGETFLDTNPTTPQPTSPQPTQDPYELPIVPNK